MTAPWSYDAIADVYATDMGQSMPFDDIGWYRALCQARGGRVLELGCGTGRILIELRAAGIDAIGVDRSLPMLQRLQRDATARGIRVPVAQMDLRQIALQAHFDVILLPYSLITYLTDTAQAVAIITALRDRLNPQGCVVLDAFVPQPVTSFSDFRLDYSRAHAGGTLQRHKRIQALADGSNRIERRYCVLAHDETVLQEFQTTETIRPYSSVQLGTLAAAAGFRTHSISWDYRDDAPEAGARFASLVLHADT